MIARLTAERGCAPTLREIADAMGLRSIGNIQRLIEALRERGRITWTPWKVRTIAVVQAEASLVLPQTLLAALQRHCTVTGDAPSDVIADAVALHLDALGGGVTT